MEKWICWPLIQRGTQVWQYSRASWKVLVCWVYKNPPFSLTVGSHLPNHRFNAVTPFHKADVNNLKINKRVKKAFGFLFRCQVSSNWSCHSSAGSSGDLWERNCSYYCPTASCAGTENSSLVTWIHPCSSKWIYSKSRAQPVLSLHLLCPSVLMETFPRLFISHFLCVMDTGAGHQGTW